MRMEEENGEDKERICSHTVGAQRERGSIQGLNL